MTNETITLQTSRLEGLEPGTEEYGVANLGIVMDFALQTVDEVTWLAAQHHTLGNIDTPVVSLDGMVKHISVQMAKQDQWYSEMFDSSAESIFPQVVKFWAENNRSCYITSDGGLWVDMAELQADMAKENA